MKKEKPDKDVLLDSLKASSDAGKEPDVRYSIVDVPVSTSGNLSVLGAPPKAGKSALLGAFISATMESGVDDFVPDNLQVTSTNPKGMALIHFDTEQSHADHHSMIQIALRRAGQIEAPAWLRSYRICDIPVKDRFELLEFEIERAKKITGGIHSVLIDGVADFIPNPNDSGKAFDIVARLHSMASLYDTAIVCVLHLNPGSTSKTRGHLGSQLERKSEANIMIEKSDGVSTVYTQSARHNVITKIKGAKFKWDDDSGMHRSWAWKWSGV